MNQDGVLEVKSISDVVNFWRQNQDIVISNGFGGVHTFFPPLSKNIAISNFSAYVSSDFLNSNAGILDVVKLKKIMRGLIPKGLTSDKKSNDIWYIPPTAVPFEKGLLGTLLVREIAGFYELPNHGRVRGLKGDFEYSQPPVSDKGCAVYYTANLYVFSDYSLAKSVQEDNKHNVLYFDVLS